MSLIFISYRRDDSAAYAGRLYDRLTERFGKGQVFMDIDQIEPGEDFVAVIERKVSACSIALVLIGKRWLDASGPDGKRRLDDPEDFVRLEIATALQRDVRVLPVLVGGAAMPSTQQLPEPLAALSRRNAIEISDTRFHGDVDRLIDALTRVPGASDPPPAAAPAARTTPRFGGTPTFVAIAVVATLAIVAAAFVFPLPLGGSRKVTPAEGDSRAAAIAPATLSSSRSGETPSSATPADDERKRSEARLALGGSPEMLQWYRQRANQGSADGQYRLAVAYECGGERNLPLALRWYKAAAAQGHAAARDALQTLEARPPDDAKERELARVRRDADCAGRLKRNVDDSIKEWDDTAREILKQTKPG